MKKLVPMLMTALVAGVILTILAPYGTSQFSLLGRFSFWMGLCVMGGLGSAAADWLANRFHLTANKWARAFFQSIIASLAVIACLLGLTVYLQGWPGPSFYIIIPFFTWIISIVICCIGALQVKDDNASERRPAIFERLKPSLRQASIYAITSEDHYVRVYTSAGEDLILMRLSDAVKETTPLEGLDVHRSWWVAEAGVKSVHKHDGKMTITLMNDVIAQVSRAKSKAVREAGWV